MTVRTGRSEIMHEVVESNGVIYFGGMVGENYNDNIEGQTRSICNQIDELLNKIGLEKANIVRAQLYITDMSLKSGMNKVWTEWMPPEYLPARATIGVADLGGPGILLEAVITATR